MITADDLVEDLVERYPDLAAFLMRRGIVCIKCGEPVWGTIADLLRSKRLDVDAILAELNAEFDKPRPRR